MLEAAVKKIATKTISEILGVDDTPGKELVAASVPEMLLRVRKVGAITGLSTPTIYRLMAKGDFPRPVKITGYARAWRLTKIMAWIESRDRGVGGRPRSIALARGGVGGGGRRSANRSLLPRERGCLPRRSRRGRCR